MKIWLDGQLVDESEAKLSVFDHAILYGDGVFEGIRIYNGKIFECKPHVDRLYESADSIRLQIPYTPDEIVKAMEDSVKANNLENGYIRLVVTRGKGTLGLNPFLCPKASVFIIADQINMYAKDMYETGMPVIIAKTVRCSQEMLDPKVKSLNYLNNIRAKIEAVDAGVLEAIMLNAQGYVAEGTGDNIFVVIDGKVVTPHESSGILFGISRGLVIDIAKNLGFEVMERDLQPEELLEADECFLSGTAVEVISVTKIDNKQIGDGKPGPITQKILAGFREYIKQQTI